jgi:hypothetical protein
MDQEAMVNANLEGGWKLINALMGYEFMIDAAFWARLSGEEKWVLYLASPKVDELGPGNSYRLIHSVLRDAPGWGIDPFTVFVLGKDNQMAKAAAEIVKPKVASGQFAMPGPRPYRDITRYSGSSLGGMRIDGTYIYPPWEPSIKPVG